MATSTHAENYCNSRINKCMLAPPNLKESILADFPQMAQINILRILTTWKQ